MFNAVENALVKRRAASTFSHLPQFQDSTMPRQFPGMDPNLEAIRIWPDFHSTFLNLCREEIADRLPEGYEARIDERISVVKIPDDRTESTVVREFIPNVAILETTNRLDAGPANTGVMSVSSSIPVTLTLEADPHRQAYLEIRFGEHRELVTVFELLSPSNKSGEGYGQYVSMRQRLLLQGVNLVELDLLRFGRRMPIATPLPNTDYFALVARGDDLPSAQLYAFSVRDPLPTIAAPLKSPDDDVPLDLARAFEIAWARGRYERALGYPRG